MAAGSCGRTAFTLTLWSYLRNPIMELFAARVFYLCILDLRQVPKTGIYACSFSGVSVATCMAILHVGSAQQVRTGSTSSKEDDYESDAATIVQKCVSQVSGDMETLTGKNVGMWLVLLFFFDGEKAWGIYSLHTPSLDSDSRRDSAKVFCTFASRDAPLPCTGPVENTVGLWQP